MRRSTCRHCGRSIVKLIFSGWAHEGSLRKPCADGYTEAEPR